MTLNFSTVSSTRDRPNPCRVDQYVTATVAFKRHGDAVARSAGHVVSNQTVFAKQSVYQGRFAYVRFADDGDLYRVVVR